MSTEPNSQPTDEAVTVVVDPRVAYVGFGPDDGPLARTAQRLGADDVIEDLADAAERLDFAYRLAWENAAARIAPDVEWNVSAPYHQREEDFPLLNAVAKTGRENRDRTDLLDQVSAALTVEVETLSVGNTRWAVIDMGRMVGSATVEWTVQSVQDRFVTELASRIADSSELLRSNEYDAIRLDLFEPAGELGAGAGALGYVLSDRGTVVFAGTDFRPSPLHAIDSDRTVEALAEFLALRAGDTDDEFFANYTERQNFWIQGDGPDRLHELIAELSGDTECRSLMQDEMPTESENLGIGLWQVKPTGRTDLPTVLLLATSAETASGQYTAYVAAWLSDTGRDIDLDDDLFPALDATTYAPVGTSGQTVVLSAVRGQQTLDWAVEHANHWGLDTVIPVDNLAGRSPLNIPATGVATVAIRNSRAVAHDGAHVDARNRSRVTALAGSRIEIRPGACVDRRRGSRAVIAVDGRLTQAAPVPRMRQVGPEVLTR